MSRCPRPLGVLAHPPGRLRSSPRRHGWSPVAGGSSPRSERSQPARLPRLPAALIGDSVATAVPRWSCQSCAAELPSARTEAHIAACPSGLRTAPGPAAPGSPSPGRGAHRLSSTAPDPGSGAADTAAPMGRVAGELSSAAQRRRSVPAARAPPCCSERPLRPRPTSEEGCEDSRRGAPACSPVGVQPRRMLRAALREVLAVIQRWWSE